MALARPLSDFVALLTRDVKAIGFLNRIVAQGTCPSVGALLQDRQIHAELRGYVGPAGEQQLAHILGQWLDMQAPRQATPPVAPLRSTPRTAAARMALASTQVPESTKQSLQSADPIRAGTTQRELTGWAEHSLFRKLALRLRIADLGLPPRTPLAVRGWLDDQTRLADVLSSHSVLFGDTQATPAVLDATLALFRLAQDGQALGQAEAQERLAQPPLANEDLQAMRLRLETLRADAKTQGLARPRAMRRIQLRAVDPVQMILDFEDLDAPLFCPRHEGQRVTLQFVDGVVRVRTQAQLCGDQCYLVRPAIDVGLDALAADRPVKHMKEFAHSLAVPPWQLVVEGVDAVLHAQMRAESTIAEERLAWRVDTTGRWWDVEPSWMSLDRKGQIRFKKVTLRDLRTRPDLCPTAADRQAVELLRPDPSVNTAIWSHASPMLVLARTLMALVGHPFIFDKLTDIPLDVRVAPVQLELRQQGAGGQWRLRVDGESITISSFLADIEAGAEHRVQRRDAEIVISPLTGPASSLLGHLAQHPDVPAAALRPFLERLPQIARLMPVQVPDTLRGRRVLASTMPVLRLDSLPDGTLSVEALVRPLTLGALLQPGQGEVQVFATDGDESVWTERDLRAERLALEDLFQTTGLPDPDLNLARLAGDAALDFVAHLADHAPHVEVLWARRRRTTRAAGMDDLHVVVRDRPDWLGLEGHVSVDDAKVDLAAVLEAIRNNRKYVQVTGDLWLQLSDSLRERLTAVADAAMPAKNGLHVSVLQADALDGLVDGNKALNWADAMGRIRGADDMRPRVPKTLKAELRGYQEQGFQWLARLATWSPGALLADDMGLGKTLQALALLLDRHDLGPALVVAPTSVESNWLREAATFAPSLRVQAWRHGDRKQASQLRASDVLVISYDLLVRDLDVLTKVSWSTLVLDEAQAIKNASTQRWKAVTQLQGEFRLALSGTPVENHVVELWAILSATVPGLLGPWATFQERFGLAIERGDSPHARAALGRVVKPFLLRRLKTEVAKDLPARVEVRVDIEPSAAERALYEQVRLAAVQEMRQTNQLPPQQRHMQVLAAITRLRQLACHPRLFDDASTIPSAKLQHVLDVIDELRAEGHRALIFSQFVRHLALLRERLDADGVPYRYLDGATPQPQRQREVEAFQQGQGDVFLISLKAGGTGLNLTAADYVLHLDPWWNPAVEDQATDRAHRIGQTRPVTVYRMVTKGSIEEAILDLHARKRDLVAGLLSGSAESASLSTEDLLALIGQGPAQPPMPDYTDPRKSGRGRRRLTTGLGTEEETGS